MATERRSSMVGVLSGLLALVFLLVLGVGVAAYALGWMTVENQPDTTTIEVNKEAIQDTANEAGAQSEELLQQAGETLQKAGTELKGTIDADGPQPDSP